VTIPDAALHFRHQGSGYGAHVSTFVRDFPLLVDPKYPKRDDDRRSGIGFAFDYMQEVSEDAQVGGSIQSITRVNDSDNFVHSLVASVGGRLRADDKTVFTSQFDTNGELRTQLSHTFSSTLITNAAYLHCPFGVDAQNLLTISFVSKDTLNLSFIHPGYNAIHTQVPSLPSFFFGEHYRMSDPSSFLSLSVLG